MRTHGPTGEPTSYGYACGYVLRRGGVSLSMEHGTYHVKRHPDHPAGHAWEAFSTLVEARRAWSRMRREVSK